MQRCVLSIRKYYPDIRIMVYDDSPESNHKWIADVPGVSYQHDPSDHGIAYGRNVLIDNCQTQYFVMVDDDVYFVDDTSLQKLYDLLESTPFTVMAGKLGLSDRIPVTCHSVNINEGVLDLRWVDKVYEYHAAESESSLTEWIKPDEYIAADHVYSFYMADKEKLGGVRYDVDTRCSDHLPFSWECKRAGKLSAYCPAVVVGHEGNQDMLYQVYRSRWWRDDRVFMHKHGVQYRTPGPLARGFLQEIPCDENSVVIMGHTTRDTVAVTRMFHAIGYYSSKHYDVGTGVDTEIQRVNSLMQAGVRVDVQELVNIVEKWTVPFAVTDIQFCYTLDQWARAFCIVGHQVPTLLWLRTDYTVTVEEADHRHLRKPAEVWSEMYDQYLRWPGATMTLQLDQLDFLVQLWMSRHTLQNS